MPKPLLKPQTKPEDRNPIKTLVLQFGPREAARMSGLSPNTVLGWAMRYKWHKNPTAKPSPNAIQSKCNQAIDQLSVYNKTTRLHLAVATNKAAKKLSKLPATKLVRPDMSVSVKNYTSTASVLHDWQQEQAGSGVVSPLTVYSKQTVIGVSRSLVHSLGQQPDKSLGKEQEQSLGKDRNQGRNQDQT